MAGHWIVLWLQQAGMAVVLLWLAGKLMSYGEEKV